ncbi:glycosyltransferase domain containing protein [Actinokineospora spheciospongiae]|uniref:Glycosyltransferase domain containing protein n=1 Tax=Actinokineospora spheciospongiae TaxID=909613 RepID=W7J628_9PSEU|nr:glycosyltransferase domain containing protein [Actinokineospora spheciospongiae]
MSETAIAGAGQRLVEITQALGDRHAVRVIARPAPDIVDLGAADLVPPSAAEPAIAAADAVLFFDTPDRERIELAVAHRKVIVGECRAPLEHMGYPSVLACPDPTGEHQRFLGAYRRLLQVAHHFLCRSQVERAALLSTLCAFGRITPPDMVRSWTLDHLVTTVPVGFSRRGLAAADAAVPRHLADFLWTGGIWAFFQPLMLVEAMAVLRDRGVDATAAYLHAAPTEDTRATIDSVAKAIADAALADRVYLRTEALPLSERDQYVKAAQAYVCVAKPGVENETGTRLRLRDTWLHGIPTVIDPYGISGDLVASEGLGVVLRDPSPESLADALQAVKTGAVAAPGRRLERLYETSTAAFADWLDEELRRG